MSKVIDAAIEALSVRLAGGFDGMAKFVIPGEGSIMVDGAGVREERPGRCVARADVRDHPRVEAQPADPVVHAHARTCPDRAVRGDGGQSGHAPLRQTRSAPYRRSQTSSITRRKANAGDRSARAFTAPSSTRPANWLRAAVGSRS